MEALNEMRNKTLKIDLERKRYYEKIIKNTKKYEGGDASKILDQLKKKQQDEDDKFHKYMLEKNRIEDEKEKKAKIKKNQDKIALKEYLEKQMEEKKRELDFEKALDNEQARIWSIDRKKYNDDLKKVDKMIKEMNRRNFNTLLEQARMKKEQNKQSMSLNEYAMNKDLLEKAKAEIDASKNN